MRARALSLCFFAPLVGAVAGGAAEGEKAAAADFRIAPVRHVEFAGLRDEVHALEARLIDEPTLSEVQMGTSVEVPLPLLELNDDIRAHPIAFSVGITGFKAGLADFLVQLYRVPAKEPFSYRRLATFALTGAVYQGLFQYWLFNVVFVAWFPGHTLRATMQKVLAANLLADPVFFFPFFYLLHEALARSPGKVFRIDTVSAALGKYYNNCLIDWRNSWSIWLPGHAVTYGVMPPHLRMPWIAAVSFGYIALLSVTRGSKGDALPPGKPTGA